MSTAEESLRFTGLFECELLVELMLRFWNHPCASNESFRNALLESAAEVLRAAVNRQQFLAEVAPANMNLVSALWYAESSTLEAETDLASEERAGREQWLALVRRTLPSCFVDPDQFV